jgi:2-dehydro-3-deoxyglucarate aldolase/4-hydroxy-2-oxoheptanedioate aldolase
MRQLENLKAKIAEGRIAFGIFITFADCAVSEIAGCAGCDFVWIDAEHGALDRREIFHHIMAAQSAGAAAFVRVPGVDPHYVKAIMDMGADGIIFPFIDSREKAELAVASCMYPPAGMRGQGPIRAIKYGLEDEQAYIRGAKDSIWKILQVENLAGYEALDGIMSVPGADTVFVGPADLTLSMDIPAEQKPAEFKRVADDIGRRLAAKGIPLGSAAGYSEADISAWADRGAKWLVVSQDARIVSLNLARIMKDAKAKF